MPDPQSPNLQLAQPTRGSDVGTWDVPVNGNMSILDQAGGGILTIGLNNSNVTLSSAQYTFKQIVFNSTLTGSVSILFPSSFIKTYEIYNTCTGSSAFFIRLTTGSGQFVNAPPGETVTIVNDGTNIRYMNLDRIGSYWDYAGSSVPLWVSQCSVPPYLNCDGSTFSSATYPQLAVILNGTTLPDSRGRVRAALDAGAGRLTSIIGDAVGNAGGDQNLQSHAHTITDPGHGHTFSSPPQQNNSNLAIANNTGSFNAPQSASTTLANAVTGISINATGAGGSQNVQPTYRGGLTLIRAG